MSTPDHLALEFLNHAAVVIEHGNLRLLSDPWFSGTAFNGGWGLRFSNPDALDRAATCTHLWISHWHSDHLQEETLIALAKRAPDIQVLANVSANFSMAERMRSFGFRNIIPLQERKRLWLSQHVAVTRFPTAGIDSMLIVKAGAFNIANYNDCNLPRMALRSIIRKVGPIGLLLTNYNHAAKLLEQRPDEVVKHGLAAELLAKIDVFQPKVVIPFASHHYYRSPFSLDQNSSMLELGDLQQLATVDGRLLPLAIGDTVTFDADWRPSIQRLDPPLAPVQFEQKIFGESLAWERLFEIAEKYRLRVASGYLGMVGWTSPLRIHVADLNRVLVLDLARGISEGRPNDGAIHITAHSTALEGWMGRRFGEDSFFDGADFGITGPDLGPLRRIMLATMVDTKHLSPGHVLGMLKSTAGIQFLINRREEIWATLVGMRWRAGESRL
jgi:L-ascorbate metabolism protein UlaG (beta-lactamase superfamily)